MSHLTLGPILDAVRQRRATLAPLPPAVIANHVPPTHYKALVDRGQALLPGIRLQNAAELAVLAQIGDDGQVDAFVLDHILSGAVRFPEAGLADVLRLLLDRYDTASLECDGFINIAHRVLTDAHIPHIVYGGAITWGSRAMQPHFWIETIPEARSRHPILRIDYRARMWLGDDQAVPHGVVAVGAFPEVVYTGQPIAAPLFDDTLIHILTMPFPFPEA